MSKKLIAISALSLLALNAYGAEGAKKLSPDSSKGFYYDNERQKYFSNDKTVFSIRPSSKREYIDKIEVSVDGAEFKPYNGTLTFAAEGPHQVRFRAVDPVLNWSPIQTFRIYVDKAAPKSQVVWKGPTFESGKTLYINPKTSLIIVGQDNLSGVSKILWGSNDKMRSFNKSASFSKEGNYSYQVYAVDNVGNKEAPYGLSFAVDGKAPSSSFEIAGTQSKNDKVTYVTTDSKINLKSLDELSGVERIEYRLNDGLATTYNRPIVLSERQTVIKYRAIDNVGNKESWKSLNVHQDVKPPLIGLSKSGQHFTISGKIYARPGFSFKVLVSDKGSGIDKKFVSLNGAPYKVTKDKLFTFNTPGESKFHLKVNDMVGNTEETDPYTVVIDNEAPQIKLKSSELLVEKDGYYLSSIPNRISFDVKDNGVGVDRVQISYDGKQFTTLNSPIELSKWKKRRQSIYYRAIDRLGNVGKAEKVEIYVRTRGPKVELYVESDNVPNVPLSQIKDKSK